MTESLEPNLCVEVAFEGHWADAYPVWTDITDRVEAIHTQAGRSDEVAKIESSTFDIVLNNEDGAFTPGRADSPYYPNVKPRKQIRVRTLTGDPVEDEPVARLVNSHVNPGAATTYGFDFTDANASYTSPSVDYGMIWIPNAGFGAASIRTFPYPATAGDYVSARFDAGAMNPSGDWVNTAARCVVVELDSNGVEVGAVSVPVNQAPLPTGIDAANPPFAAYETVNYQVTNVATTQVLMAFEVEATAGTATMIAKSWALYNHGATAMVWPGAVPCVTGDLEELAGFPEWSFYWIGNPDKSASVAMAPASGTGEHIARGVIERWPVDSAGTSNEVTVPAVDWFGPMSSRELDIPYYYALRDASLNTLYKFNEDEPTKDRAAFTNPALKARDRVAFPVDRYEYLYDFAGRENEPFMTQTEQYQLLPANPEVKSAAASNQFVRTATDGSEFDYANGVAIEADIPPLTFGAESWSVSLRYHCWQILKNSAWPNGGAPVMIALRDSRSRAALTVRLTPDAGETKLYVGSFAVSASRGQSWVNTNYLGTIPFNESITFVLSWDAPGNDFRVMFEDLDTGAWVGESLTQNDGDYLPADLPGFFKGARFNRAQLLGWVDPRYREGFAAHAVGWFATHDEPLYVPDAQRLRAAAEGNTVDTVTERVNAILDAMEWPRDMRALDPIPTRLPALGWQAGEQALPLLKKAVEDSGGVAFVDTAGRAAAFDRSRRVYKVEPDWVFDLEGSTGIESGLSFEQAQEDLVNRVALDNAGGINTILENPDSVAEFGPSEQTLSVALDREDDALQYGYHLLNRYSQPITRVKAVSIRPSAGSDPYLWDAALHMTIGDRVRLSGLPGYAPAATMDFYVESIGHDIVRAGERLDWLVTFDISPAGLSDGWILGSDFLGVNTLLHF